MRNHLFASVLVFYVSFNTFITLSDQREMILEKVETFPEPNIFQIESLRVKKFNRTTYVLDGEFFTKLDLDDSIDFTVVANNLNGQQYKKIMERKFVKFCQALWDKSMIDTYADIMQSSNIPEFGSCPFKADNYWMKNMLMKDSKLLPAYLPGGEQWRLDVRFYKGEEMIGGYIVYLTITKDTAFG